MEGPTQRTSIRLLGLLYEAKGRPGMTTPTPIATIAHHGADWGIVVGGIVIYHEPSKAVAIAIASVINGAVAGVIQQHDEPQRNELLRAVGMLLVDVESRPGAYLYADRAVLEVVRDAYERARGEAAP